MIRHLFFMLFAAVASAQAATALEYRFNVGEELVYELVGEEDLLEKKAEPDRRHEKKARWKVYTARQNKDGSWHLVVQTSVKHLQYDRERSSDGKLGEWKTEPSVPFANTFLGYCDLMPDGSYAENTTLGQHYQFKLLPELLFMPLPLNSLGEQPAPRIAPTSGTSYLLQPQSRAHNMVRLTGALVETTGANYEATDKCEVDFDAAAGRARQIVITSKLEWKDFPSYTRTTYGLVEVAQHTPEWMAKFEADASRYFQDSDAWWEHKKQASRVRTADACRTLVTAARQRIEESTKLVEIAEIQSAYDGLLALHDREVEWDIQGAATRESIYAKPPVDWMSNTLAGEPRRRDDYNGKIVILDFWHRGCRHCILALPKVKALHAKYKDHGAVVLGVSHDMDLANALHVVNTFSIPYENIRDLMTPISGTDPEPTDGKDSPELAERRISSEYRVSSWPTFIVLDQTGRVAEVVESNSEDLVEHLSRVIDELLAAPPTE